MSTTTRVVLPALFCVIAFTRFTHTGFLWVEEAYPSAAAAAILQGKFLYRDIWFDKPPLFAVTYLLWDAQPGIWLRWAGTLFAALAVALMYRLALTLGGARAALPAACMTGIYLTFGIPSAVMALAPDLLMLVPHVAAIWLIVRGRAVASGFLCGIAMLVNTKAFLVLVVCLVWAPRAWLRLLAGFAVPNAFALAALAANHALDEYWQQVWVWGWHYSRDSFLRNPLAEGLRRTANWAGFHAAAVVGAVWFFAKGDGRRPVAAWLCISALAVLAGERFFPRYYFQLLPAVILAASRGVALMRPQCAGLVLLLMLIPIVRFGPRYVELAADAVGGRAHVWRDLAMTDDSRAASEILRAAAPPGATLLVWGYRPDIFIYSGLAAGTQFLDSQPLTGVIADRHLAPDARPTFPDLAARNRELLRAARPTFIVDGLGPYNASLGIDQFAGLREWLAQYREIGRTRGCVIYQLAPAPPRSSLP